MNLLEDLQKVIVKAKTPDQAEKIAVDYLTKLDFKDDNDKNDGLAFVSHLLGRVQNGESLNLLETKAMVMTLTKVIAYDFGLDNIKVKFRDKKPDEKLVAAYYVNQDRSVTFFNDSNEFLNFMSSNLSLNSRLNLFSQYIVRVVAHELRHAVQYDRLTAMGLKPEEITQREYLTGKQFLAQELSEIAPKYRRSDFYQNLYLGNHDNFIYELDADAAAHNETISILQDLSPVLFQNQMRVQSELRRECLNKLNHYDEIEWGHDTNPNNDLVNANHKASLVLDTVLPQINGRDRKNMFEENPILNITYNSDGSKKPLEQVERERDANINRLLVMGTPEEVKKKVPKIIRTYETAIESDPVLSFERCMRQIADLSWDGTRYYTRGGETLEERYDHAKVISELNAAVEKAKKLASYIEESDFKIIRHAFAKCNKDLELSKKTDLRSTMFYDEKRSAMFSIEQEIMKNRDFKNIMDQDKKEAAKRRMIQTQAEETLKKVFPNFTPQTIVFDEVAGGLFKEANNVEQKLLLLESYKKYVQDSTKYRQTKHKMPEVSSSELLNAIFSLYDFQATDEQKQEFEKKLKAGEITPLKNIYSDDGYLELKQELLPHKPKEAEPVTAKKPEPAKAPEQSQPIKPLEEEKSEPEEEYDEYGVKIQHKPQKTHDFDENIELEEPQHDFERGM